LLVKDLRRLYVDIKKTIEISEEVITPSFCNLLNHNSCFILGKGKGEAIAREGSLKIKEISYIHCEGYSASSLKHGPFALLGEGFPVILLDICE
jgi:glucosamine--fructose-6-phosphate aminotransferase (isomerizing)